NYCQRQGRCTVGCLPGARHTLNKQLMQTMYGGIDNNTVGNQVPPPTVPGPLADFLSLEPLAEVDWIEPLVEGGYKLHYRSRKGDVHGAGANRTITAEKVILAAGTVGTIELLLRSREKMNRQANAWRFSDELGSGFSGNGDYIGFVRNTKEQVRLIKGPVTTSFATFNTKNRAPGKRFHTIEDNGIPPALASSLSFGLELVDVVSRGGHSRQPLLRHFALEKFALKRFGETLAEVPKAWTDRETFEESEDEFMAHTMCVTAFGEAQVMGKFRLGGAGETSLRVQGFDKDTMRAAKPAGWQPPAEGPKPMRFEND